MKIRKIVANNRKKCFEILLGKGWMDFPYDRLTPGPTIRDRVQEVYPDLELGREGFTYVLESGKENSVHIDEVLEYNKDPDYLRNQILYQLTLKAQEILKKNKKLPRRTVIRRMGSSPTQFYRLLDQTNYHKTVDQMLKLLGALDCDVDLKFREAA